MKEIVLIAFGALFFGGGALLFYSAIAMRRMVKAARSWPSVEGTILRSTMGATSGSQGGSWVPVVEYEYEVDGERHESNAIAIGGATGMLKGAAEKTVARYPEGARVQVFFDPAHPKSPCLERRSTNSPIAFGLGAVTMIAGVAMIGFGISKL